MRSYNTMIQRTPHTLKFLTRWRLALLLSLLIGLASESAQVQAAPINQIFTQSANEILILFSEDVTLSGVSGADFTVSGAASNPTVSSVGRVNDEATTSLLLTLSADILKDETITLSYGGTTGGIASFTNQAVLNFVPSDTGAPVVVRAETNLVGTAIVLTFNEAININATSATDFTVTAGERSDTEIAVTRLTVNKKTLTLKLASAIAHGDTVLLEYAARAGVTGIADAAGNVFEKPRQEVTNKVSASNPEGAQGQVASINHISTLSANEILILFSGDVTLSGVSGVDFTVSGAASNPTVSSVGRFNDKATTSLLLTLSADISLGESITLAYTKGTGSITVTGKNTPLASFANQVVMNLVKSDTRAPVVASAETNTTGDSIALTFNEAININAVLATDFTVAAGKDARTIAVTRLTANEKTLTLELASAIAQGETVLLEYAASGTGIADAAGNARTKDRRQVTNKVSAENQPPMGHVSISMLLKGETVTATRPLPAGQTTLSATPTVGNTLTAVTSEISDADGPTTLSFSYQWQAGGDDIATATAETFTLTRAQLGKQIKVQVSYTDGANHIETLASAQTNQVKEANTPPIASGDEITGASGASSHTPAITTTALTVKAAAFTLLGTVDAGATVDVLKAGNSIGSASVTGTSWSLDVTLDDGANTFTATATDATGNTSDATDAVIITLDLDLDLDTTPSFGSAAITSQTYTAGTAIPVLTLPKATGGNGVLTYSLSSSLPRGLTFDTTRRTISGTPETETASTSYTYIAADSDTNTAATDTASLTFSITVLSDGLSEEDIQRLNLAIMPRLTQALVASAAASVERRVDSAFASAETTASYQLDGYQIQFDSETTTTEKLTADLLQKLAGYTRSHKDGNINWKQLLTNSSFLIPLNSADQTSADQASAANTGLALWGSGDYTRLSENDSDLDWQGDLSSYQLGLDKRLDNLLLGGMVTWSEGDVDYTLEGDEGSYNHKMTSIHPYLAWNNARANLWGSLGYGQGDLTIKQEDNSHSTDTNLLSLAAGIKGQLISGLSLKSDLLLARTDINAAADMNIAKQTIDSQRFRLLLEIAGQYTLASGGSIKPMLEIGARYDGDSGDSGNSGTGAVLGAGMRYANLTGLTLEGNLHALVGQGNYKEWGIQASISLDPGTDKLGLAFSLRPGYGYNGSSSDTSALWQQSLPQSNLHSSAVDYRAPDYDARLGARLSYGLLAPSLVGLLTPYSEITLGTINSYRLGIRWQGTTRFDLHLFGERRESSVHLDGSRGADQAIQLEGRIHF